MITQKHDIHHSSSVVACVKDVKGRSISAKNALLFRIWGRNALKPVIALSMDVRDPVEAKVTCTTDTTQIEQIEFHLTTLKREIDRFECILSGLDRQ